jgi:hypothetical protein
MAGFFAEYLKGLRIALCARQVVANILSLSPEQGCRLALILALYRARMLNFPVPGGMGTISEMVQHPAAYRKELCYTAFRLLRDMRQISREEMQSYASFKISPAPKVKEQAQICDLAFSLLMTTVGTGYRPSTLEAATYAWNHLATFSPTAADIGLIMKMPEYIVHDVIVQPLETEEWIELARQGPDFLKPAL